MKVILPLILTTRPPPKPESGRCSRNCQVVSSLHEVDLARSACVSQGKTNLMNYGGAGFGQREGMNDRPNAASGQMQSASQGLTAPRAGGEDDPSGSAKSEGAAGDGATDDGGKAASPRRSTEEPIEPRKLSAILAEIASNPERERISVGDLVKDLHLRAFGAMLLIFALPNAVPTPPGTSAILGLPLLYLTFQLMMGRTPWLPGFISNRSMKRQEMAALIDRLQPWLQRAERLLAPRLLVLTTPISERVVGALALILAIILVLPIPLGNMLPALAISMMALGILEKDGAWIISGVVVGMLSLIIVYGVVFAFIKAFIFVIFHAFS